MREEVCVVFGAGAGVAQLQQDKLGGNDGLVERYADQRLCVSRVIGPQQGQVEKRVREDRAHGFPGSPLT